MMNKTIVFCLLLLSINPIFAENKIVYLISPPRSLSVAFLRMMEARNDFTIMHEPSMLAYHFLNCHYDTVKDWFYNDAPKTFDEVKQKIFNEAQQSNVFVKEMGWAVKDFLLKDTELVCNTNVYFVFLIRNPHHAILSFYKKVSYCNIDIMGYKATYEIFNDVKSRAANAPLIILSEALYTKPRKTVEMLCKHLQIPFKEDSLHWSDLGHNFSGINEWNEIKHQENTHHWHAEAIHSCQFIQPTHYEVDQSGWPTFNEIANQKDKEHCIAVYNECLKYYNLLLAEVDNVLTKKKRKKYL